MKAGPFFCAAAAAAVLAAAFGLLRAPRPADFEASPPGLLLFNVALGPDQARTAWVSDPLPPVPGGTYRIEVAGRSTGEIRFYLRGEGEGARWSRIGAFGPAGEFETASRVVFLLPKGPCRLVLERAPETVAVFGRVAVAGLRPEFVARRLAVFWLRVAALLAALALGGVALRGRLSPRGAVLLYRLALPAALAFVVAAGLSARYDARHGFNGLLSMGDRLFARATAPARTVDFRIESREGYDGAQYVQLAFDPLLRDRDGLRKALDIPSYRAKRILVPWLSWLVGLGRPAWIAQAESLLNAAFWALLLAVLLRAFPRPSWEGAAVLTGVLLSTGVLESLRNALTDLPAAALLALGLAARGAGRPLAWGAAVLCRETSLLAAPFLPRFGEPRWGLRPAVLAALAAAGTFVAAWFGYVLLRLPGGGAEVNFAWPFQGIAARIAAIPAAGGWGAPRNLFAVAAMASLAVQAAFFLRHPRPASAAWRLGIAFALLYPCLGFLVWENYHAAARAMLPLTLAFHWELASRRGAPFWGWWLPANLFLLPAPAVYLMPD